MAASSNLWAATLFRRFQQHDGIIFHFRTNRPCHLWLYYTSHAPVKHLEPLMRRGLEMHCNPRFCFVAPSSIEQHEPGDTEIHSFNWHPFPGWHHCHCLLKGTIGGVESPSTSPIMYFYQHVENAYSEFENTGMAAQGVAVTYNNPKAVSFKVPDGQFCDCVRIWCYAPLERRNVTLSLYAIPWDGTPTGIPLTTQIYPHITDKRIFPNRGYFDFVLPNHVYMAQNYWYCLVIYGDQYHPDDLALWWSVSFIGFPGVEWRGLTGVKQNGWWGWVKSGVWCPDFHPWGAVSYSTPW